MFQTFVTINPMQRIAWIIGILLVVPSARAGEWEKLSTDLDLYDQVIVEDDTEMHQQREDALLEDIADLFPGADENQDQVNIQDEEEFAIIEVDGVQIVLSDVPTEEWFAPFVKDAAELNLISGYRNSEGSPTGEFGPADFVTVEQLAKMAVLAAGIDPYGCGDTLKNTSAKDRWSHRFVQCAEYHRWAIFSDGSINVSEYANRSDVVVTVLQAFSVRISPVSGTVFEDVTRSTPFGNAIETSAQDGVVSGYTDSNGNPTGYFGPGDPVNRAETAKIFSLSSKIYGDR